MKQYLSCLGLRSNSCNFHRDRLIRDLMNRRLEEIEKRGPYSPDSGDFSKSPDRQGNNAQDASVASNTNRANSVDVTANE